MLILKSPSMSSPCVSWCTYKCVSLVASGLSLANAAGELASASAASERAVTESKRGSLLDIVVTPLRISRVDKINVALHYRGIIKCDGIVSFCAAGVPLVESLMFAYKIIISYRWEHRITRRVLIRVMEWQCASNPFRLRRAASIV